MSESTQDIVIDVTPPAGTELAVSMIESVADERINPPLPAVRTSTADGGARRFDYGYTKINDVIANTSEDPKKKGRRVDSLIINDEHFLPTPRFWTSVLALYGISQNIFHYFEHHEVFQRISDRATNDRIRFCVHREPNQAPKLLAATRPEKAVIPYDDLMETLQQYQGENIQYFEGLVNSTHTPRIGGDNWAVGDDKLVNRFCIEAPVDGYGKPSIYLACVRLACENGAVARTPAFKTELNIGKGDDVVRAAVIRALDSFNSDEGYAALHERFNAAAHSWASVREHNSLYKLLVRLHSQELILGHTRAGRHAPSEEDVTKMESPILKNFHQMTGDVVQLYGLANLDALSKKRQATLPVKCKVYDLINFATEVATHTAKEHGRQQLHGWVGSLIGDEGGFDMDGSAERWADFQDFFLQSDIREVDAQRRGGK